MITGYEAISIMRKLTKDGKTFSFTHATFSQETQTSNGLTQLTNAKLRPAPTDETLHGYDRDMYLFYINDLGEPRTCFKTLITQFNGQQVVWSK